MKIFTWDGLPVSHSALLKAHGGENVVVVMPSLVRALKGHGNAAILLSQLLYWSARSEEPNGWFYNNRDKLSSQTGIGRDGLTTARALLRKLGILEETRAGMPAKLYMRLNLSAIARLIESQEKPPPTRVTDMPPQQELRACPANMSAGHTPSARVMGMPGSLSKEEKITKRLEEEITEESAQARNAPPEKPASSESFSPEQVSPESVPTESVCKHSLESPLAKQIRAICKKGIMLSQRDQRELQEVLTALSMENATPEQAAEFGRKVHLHWIGRDSKTGQSRAPRIIQVLEHWHEVLSIDLAEGNNYATDQFSHHSQPNRHNQPNRMPARVANDEAAAERFIARRRERAANANR